MAEKEYIERVNYCKNICLCSEDKCEKDKCPIWCVSTADVAPVRHGHWIRPDGTNTRSYKWQCSECGQIAYWLHYGSRGSKNIICKFGYCPHCGAKMDEQ